MPIDALGEQVVPQPGGPLPPGSVEEPVEAVRGAHAGEVAAEVVHDGVVRCRPRWGEPDWVANGRIAGDREALQELREGRLICRGLRDGSDIRRGTAVGEVAEVLPEAMVVEVHLSATRQSTSS